MEIKKGVYKHFKGHVYNVIGVAKHSETLQEMAVYVNSDNNNDIWVRPIEMFIEKIEKDGKILDRFTLMKELE